MENESINLQMNELTDTFIEVITVAVDKFYGDECKEGIELTLDMLEAIIDNGLVNRFFSEDTDRINQVFTEITASIENKDYVLTCDLLEFELLPLYLQWKRKMG